MKQRCLGDAHSPSLWSPLNNHHHTLGLPLHTAPMISHPEAKPFAGHGREPMDPYNKRWWW